MENLETQNNEQLNGDNPFITEPEVSLGKNALIYGAILGGISVVFSIIQWVLGQTLNKTLSYVPFIFMLGVMFYGTKEYRDKHLGGYMMYGTAFTSNFLIALYSTIISGVFTLFLYKFMDPGLIDRIMNDSMDTMLKNPKLSTEQVDQAMAMVRKFTTPLSITIIFVVTGAIGSAILALIVSIFNKKEQPLL